MKKKIIGIVLSLAMITGSASPILAQELVESGATIVSEDELVCEADGNVEKIIRGYLADDELIKYIGVYEADDETVSIQLDADMKDALANQALSGVNIYEDSAPQVKVYGIENDVASELSYRMEGDELSIDANGYKNVAVLVTILFKYDGNVYEEDELTLGKVELSEYLEDENSSTVECLSEDALASSYDNRDNMPMLRNQGEYNTCWAYTMIALAEANLIKKGLVANPDLSEGHLAYFHYNNVIDPLRGTEGDNNTAGNSEFHSDAPWDIGGNLSVAQSILSRWMGAASEEVAPYSSFNVGYDPSIAYQDVVHLENTYMADVHNDRTAVKNLITNVGAAGVQIYTDVRCYNSTYNSYYNTNENVGGSHLVTLVGWDDNFPADHFNNKPQGDGAWLVRNSWVVADKNSGDYNSFSGYFWMSYYDKSLRQSAIATEYDMADKYNNNYQYDGGVNTSQISGYVGEILKCSNVFTASANESGETLKAISFFNVCPNVNYIVDIYVNPTSADDPESGVHVAEATTAGTVAYEGYHTVELSNPVAVSKGDKFAVVITLDGGSEGAAIGVEFPMPNGWFKSEVSSQYGQSYVNLGEGWKDTKDFASQWVDGYNNYNLRIKAFTNNVYEGIKPTYSIKYVLNGGKNNSKNPATYDSGSAKITLGKATKKGYTFAGWYDDSKFKKKITAIETGSSGDITLYAKWTANKYTIKFNANGGKGKMANKAMTYGKAAKLTKNAYTRKGYKFLGWSTDKKAKKAKYKNAASVKNLTTKNKGTVTLYAVWKKK